MHYEFETVWACLQVPFQSNVTCNRTCVYRLVDDAYFNLEETYIARARPAYITTDASLVQVRCWHSLTTCINDYKSRSLPALI